MEENDLIPFQVEKMIISYLIKNLCINDTRKVCKISKIGVEWTVHN